MSSHHSHHQSASKPPVIVFMTDQQRWDTVGVAGNPENLTPNLDQAARSGVWFDNAYTPQPVCAPARSSLLTGQFATQTGVFRNGIPLDEEAETLATRFGAAGYSTGYIGKWHLGDPSLSGPVPHEQRGGFQSWLAANTLEHVSDAYRTRLWDENEQEVDLPGYRVDALADAAIRYIGGHRAEPFFLFLSFLEPHHENHRDDYPAPAVYRDAYRNAWLPPDLAALTGNAPQHISGYYGMVRRLDEAYGRILDALRSLDLFDDAIVAVVSDHGNHFRTRNSEYKRSVHDASTRVPLALHGPGLPRGRVVEDVVSTVSLPATLLDLAGITPGPGMQPSLKPVIWSNEPPAGEAFFQISEAEVGRGIRTRRWKYGVTAPDKDPVDDSGSAVYVEAHLYDLEADPYELNNLIGLPSHRQIADHLRGRLLAWMAAAGEDPAQILPVDSDPDGRGQLQVDLGD